MEKNIYEMFNHTSLNEEEYNSIEEDLTLLEKKEIKKDLRKKLFKEKNKKIKITAASIVLISIITAFLAKPAFANAFIRINPIIESVYKKLGYYNDYNDFSKYVGMSKEDKGYKFTIDKLIADEDTVTVAMRIYKEGLNKRFEDKTEEESNSKKNQFMMTASVLGKTKTIDTGRINQGKLDENTSIIIIHNDAAINKKIPQNFQLKINVHSMLDGEANANFDLKVSRENTEKNTIIKKNLGIINFNNLYNIKVDKIKTSPVNTKVQYSFDGKSPEYINFYMYDEKGRKYSWRGSKGQDGINMSILDKVENDAKIYYLVPYLFEKNSDVSKPISEELDFYNENFSLDKKREFNYKGYGKINVYNIEKSSNSVKVYYTIEGNLNKVFDRAPIELVVKNGEKFDPVDINNINTKLYKIDSKNNYCVEFDNLDMKNEHKYTVTTHLDDKIVEGTPMLINLK